MLSQFAIQYGINTCCLRTPWILEKDDFRYSLSFGDDVFGGPVCSSLVALEVAKRCQAEGTVPLLRDAHGNPLKRNFVHVEDLVAAILAALDKPLTGKQALQHRHGRARRLRGGRCISERDARAELRGYSQQLPLELDRQQSGQIRARMAAPL
jgi:nucleoside-diphosphate-sugar epimerase